MNLPKTQLKVLNAIDILSKNEIPATNYSISILTGIAPDNVRWNVFHAMSKGYIKKSVKNGDIQFSLVRY